MFEFLDLDLKKYMDQASHSADLAEMAAAGGDDSMSEGLGISQKGGAGRRARRGLPPDLVAKLLQQLLLGLAHLHSRRILHRDLKPQNLLIDKSGNLKVRLLF